MLNQIDRFDLAIDVIDRVPRLQATVGAHAREQLKNKLIEHRQLRPHPRRGPARDPRLAVDAARPGPASPAAATRCSEPEAELRVLVVNAGSSSLKLARLDDDGAVAAATTVERWEGEGHLEPLAAFLDGVRAGRRRRAPRRARRPAAHRARASSTTTLLGLPGLDRAPRAAAQPARAGRHPRRCASCCPASRRSPASTPPSTPTCRPPPRTYALPREWNERWGLRRYGFHGLSPRLRRTPGRGARRPGPSTTCGSSRATSAPAPRWPPCAAGVSVDTTMGFTPLAGLVMDTRPGHASTRACCCGCSSTATCRAAELADVARAPRRAEGALRARRATCATCSPAGRPATRTCALAFDVYLHRLAPRDRRR